MSEIDRLRADNRRLRYQVATARRFLALLGMSEDWECERGVVGRFWPRVKRVLNIQEPRP